MLRRLAVVAALATVAGTALACEPTTPAPAPFTSIAAWQSTTWAFAKLVRPISDVGTDGLFVQERDSGHRVPARLICKPVAKPSR